MFACVLVANLPSGGVDGLVGVSTDGVHKLSIDEDLVRELNLSVVGLDHCLQGNRERTGTWDAYIQREQGYGILRYTGEDGGRG